MRTELEPFAFYSNTERERKQEGMFFIVSGFEIRAKRSVRREEPGRPSAPRAAAGKGTRIPAMRRPPSRRRPPSTGVAVTCDSLRRRQDANRRRRQRE